MGISLGLEWRRYWMSFGIVGSATLAATPFALAQSQSFFDTQVRPNRLSACSNEACWEAAIASCQPAQYRTTVSIDIATADTTLEIWGLQGQSCVTYGRTEQLIAFGQDVPEGRGMESICVYKNAADVVLEWEIMMGRQEGTFGGEGGMIDPQTGIGRSTKTINGREVAVCDVYMPAALNT